MKLKNKKHIIAIFSLTMLLNSCSENFLEEVNPNNQTPSTYWVNEGNMMKGLSAVYNPIRRMSWGYYGGYEGILHYQMRADDMYPTRGEEASIWQTIAFTNTPNTSNGVWNYLYIGVQLANEFLYNAPNVPNIDKNKLDEMLGEAYFIRGFEYFRIRTDFNEGVIRTLPQDSDPKHHSLSTSGEVLDELMVNYEDNFRDDAEFNKESIWEINFAAFGNTGDAWGSSTGDNAFMGNTIGHYFGPALKGPGVSGMNKGGGWYKMQPSPYLMQQFIAEPRPSGSNTIR